MQPKFPRSGLNDTSVAQRVSLPPPTLLLSMAMAWTGAGGAPAAVLLQRPSVLVPASQDPSSMGGRTGTAERGEDPR